MAFQGNLRDFGASEILQLLGSQKKTGCLSLDRDGEKAHIYVLEGRIVSTRQSGMAKDDPLLRFLLKAHRLSDEQYRGISTIQRESNRDLEDLLVNGRYLDGEELGGYIERQILDDLMRLLPWNSGTYHFDPHNRWTHAALARLSIEGALIEVARRFDEEKRFAPLSQDTYQLLVVRDLPDSEHQLTEEECEIFGLIDGQHTVADIVQAAPLSEYETYEALHRMLDANLIQVEGRRMPGSAPPPTPATADAGRAAASAPRVVIWKECVLAAVVIGVTSALAFGARSLTPHTAPPTDRDVFATARLNDVRYALELFRREHGQYPRRLDELIDDRWIAPDAVRISGLPLRYASEPDGQQYRLGLSRH